MTKRYELSVKLADGTWINKVGSVTDWGNDKVQCSFTDKQIKELAELISQGTIKLNDSQYGNFLNLNGKLKETFNKEGIPKIATKQDVNNDLFDSVDNNKNDNIPF
jgi:hypothetical protein